MLTNCKECGQATQKRITILGSERIVPITCKCKKEAYEKATQEESHREKQDRLKRVFKNSLMDEKLFESTFENWDHSLGDKRMFNIAKKYAENFKEMKEKNIGLIIHGEPGNGKTYMTSCIANELLKRSTSVTCVSIDSILGRIKRTFDSYGKEGEFEIINTLGQADLLILDDLGTEVQTEWSRRTIYNIIDNRYRMALPLIVTTNIKLEDIQKFYGKRTYDRLINEMCTPVENRTQSIRRDVGKAKTDALRIILKG